MLENGERAFRQTEAHNDAMALPMSDVVSHLVDLLGATTVAALAGVGETRAVAQWISGHREPQRPHVIRFALQLAMIIDSEERGRFAGAWFYGSNPHLEDRSPLALLRDDPLEEVQGPLMRAVRTFNERIPSRNGKAVTGEIPD